MIWKPTPIQELALQSTADEVLFGGARGGGKTDTALQWILYDINNPQLRGLVIRRNATDLKDFVDRAYQKYYPLGATIKGNPAEIHFQSGAIFYTGHLRTDDAYTKYQGWEIHRLLMEEVTHIPSEKLYMKLLGSVRSTVPNLKTQVFLTTNPGNVGHEWVKNRFEIDVKPAKKKFFKKNNSYIYIPATIHDNPHLKDADPGYIARLEAMDETTKQQWLYGSWDDFDMEGSYYSKLLKDKQPYKFDIDLALPVHTAWDLGINDSMAIWFYQVFNQEIRLINYYENFNEGFNHYKNYLQDFRDKLGFTWGKHFAPHDIMVRELSGDGLSRLESARKIGLNFEVTKKVSEIERINAGRVIISRCHFHLNTEEGYRLLKNYRKEFDDKRQVFRDKPLHDQASHCADAFTYLALNERNLEPFAPRTFRAQTNYKRF